MSAANRQARALAFLRIAVGLLFLIFAQYKLTSTRFIWGGMASYISRFIDHGCYPFMRHFLKDIILPHAVFFGYVVGVVELLIGISFLLGLWVRPASVLAILFLLNMLLATWWEPGHGVPIWRYVGAELDHLPLLLLCIIFFAADAGRVWGLDGRRA